jgi:hypothetical protein
MLVGFFQHFRSLLSAKVDYNGDHTENLEVVMFPKKLLLPR